ncbi:hypothetical protein LZ554_001126 [Drepanopeziza brunnea f. sp. 'monogermtubi']|nr:hypothetical protein LZ554_001126 [Drepanopeziza brunnea f. sp. 'monogermtubi']
MVSAIVRATIQSCTLNVISNLMAQMIRAYRSNSSYEINWTPVFQFVLFNAINCPPNFLWASFLEGVFPSQTLVPSNPATKAAATNNEKELDRDGKTHEVLESRLSVKNTLAKFTLDQTIGAAMNTFLFSLVFAGFRGAGFAEAVQVAKDNFWPMIRAGWTLWPAVSFANFALIKTVQGRQLLGSLAGMAWGIYLSLTQG